MINWTLVEDSLQAWAEEHSGVTAIWANQSALSPEPPYITLAIINVKKIGAFDETRHGQNGFKKCGLRRITVSVQAYGKNALSIISRLKDSLELDVVEAYLKQSNVAPVTATDITRIPEFINTIWEDRAHIDAIFHISDSESQDETFALEGIKAKVTFKGGQTGEHNGTVEI